MLTLTVFLYSVTKESLINSSELDCPEQTSPIHSIGTSDSF